MPLLYQQQSEDLFADSNASPPTSPNTVLFPPEMGLPGSLLPRKPSYPYSHSGHRERHSISELSDHSGYLGSNNTSNLIGSSGSGAASYSSRPPSLSPSGTSAALLQANTLSSSSGSMGLSPHSLASPQSAFSNGGNAGYGYGGGEDIWPAMGMQDNLDMFFAMDGDMGYGSGMGTVQDSLAVQSTKSGERNQQSSAPGLMATQQQQPVLHLPFKGFSFPSSGFNNQQPISVNGNSDFKGNTYSNFPNTASEDTFNMLNIPEQDGESDWVTPTDFNTNNHSISSSMDHTTQSTPHPGTAAGYTAPYPTYTNGNSGLMPGSFGSGGSVSSGSNSRRYSVISTESFPVHVRNEFRNSTDTSEQQRRAAEEVAELRRRSDLQEAQIRMLMQQGIQPALSQGSIASVMGQMHGLQGQGQAAYMGGQGTMQPNMMNLPSSAFGQGLPLQENATANNPPGLSYPEAQVEPVKSGMSLTGWGVPRPAAPSGQSKTAAAPKPKGRPPKNRAPAPPKSLSSASPPNLSDTSAAHPTATTSEAVTAPGGKHNKTERRYRQKVQVAQAQLRDSVPALRVLYGTSTPEQKATTDIKAADGTVDGLGEVSRPNASAKATIFNGARLYIELLQERVAGMQRKVDELESFRSAVAGENEMMTWRMGFEAREKVLLDQLAEMRREQGDELDNGASDESESEDEAPKKRKRVTKKSTTVASDGVRVFAAFAMSFSLVPSASTLLRPHQHHASNIPITPGHVLSGATTPTQVISRLPLITAEHLYQVFIRFLPVAVVPGPGTMVDWTWRLLVAAVLILVLGPMVGHWRKSRKAESEQDERYDGLAVGNVWEMGKDLVGRGSGDEEQWVKYAAAVVGKVETPTSIEKAHLAVRLGRSTSAYSLTLLALLQASLPLVPSSERLWQQAHSSILASDSPALHAVLALPLDEALAALSLLSPTSDPLSAMSEQITLVHLNDLYSRLFVHLVNATTQSQTSTSTLPISVSALYDNLQSGPLRSDLSNFDQEIRQVLRTGAVAKGTAAHALGLVLIGLWGVFTGPAPSAQAALISALAGEEVKGAGRYLGSVAAMIDLLYPGASSRSAGTATLADEELQILSQNALALDKLALVCIGYVQLLSNTTSLTTTSAASKQSETGNEQPSSAEGKQAVSLSISKATAALRLVISETDFIGLDNIHADDAVDADDTSDEAAPEGSETSSDGDGDQLDNQTVVSPIENTLGPQGNDESVSRGGIESEKRKFEIAKERLVAVLSIIGRRAAGRCTAGEGQGMGGDSGLDEEIDEM